jgi:hypothetical protein
MRVRLQARPGRRGPGEAYGTKMAEAVAPVCLTPSSTVAKTGLPRCSVPAFLGFVPPTTFVPASRRQWGQAQGRAAAHTVLDGLAGVEAVRPSAKAAPHARRGDSRSLLAREALEQHLCVAVDAQVLDRVRVGRGARCVCVPGGCFPHRRAQGSSYGLHRDGRGHGTDACVRGRMDGWRAEGVRFARVPVRSLAANLKLYSCFGR